MIDHALASGYTKLPSYNQDELAKWFVDACSSGTLELYLETFEHTISVMQTEDEISAIGAVIGAGFGGKRAMTATSGPGFALMTEFTGLSVMAEVPAVIIDSQRAGPSTGMPTKTEQSDFNSAVSGGTGDCPRIVLAPIDTKSCYDATVLALYLAEKYQLPVILLTDKQLTESFATIDLEKEEKEFTFDYDKKIISGSTTH